MAIGHLELAALLLDLAKQPRVLDGERRLGAEGLQQLHGLGRKLAGRIAVDHQAAHDLALAQERDGEQGAEARVHERVAHGPRVHARHGDIRELYGLAGLRGASERALAQADRHGAQGFDHVVVDVPARAEMEDPGGLLELVDRRAVGAREMPGLLGDGRQHTPEVERGADGLADLAERLQLIDRSSQLARARLQLLEQAHVLDRDDRLIGEGLEQRDLLLGEGPDLHAPDRHDADR